MPRKLLIAFIVVIMIACTASAYFGLRSGHTARALSTFFAGSSMSILIWSQTRRNML
jgi:uncharacterized membrane protein